jgi:transcriptional regulator with XRE-family HTH domain
MQTIGGRIRHLREKKGVTVTEVAKAIAVSKSNISSFENNKSKPSIDALISLSNYFDVSSDWILKGDTVLNKERTFLRTAGMDVILLEVAERIKNNEVPQPDVINFIEQLKHSVNVPPGSNDVYQENLDSYEFELVQKYRRLSEREQGRVDQFVNSLAAHENPQTDGKQATESSDLMNGRDETVAIIEDTEAGKETA